MTLGTIRFSNYFFTAVGAKNRIVGQAVITFFAFQFHWLSPTSSLWYQVSMGSINIRTPSFVVHTRFSVE